jgi:hypothetical protein
VHDEFFVPRIFGLGFQQALGPVPASWHVSDMASKRLKRPRDPVALDIRRLRPIKAKLAKLRPTQMALGYAEVARKRKEWRQRTPSDAKRFLGSHRFPAVRGPGGHHYILDHHHLGRALQEEKVEAVMLAVLTDMSHLDKGEFWIVMALRQWAHPYDKRGRLRDFSAMPKKLKLLPDDPYRSLAAEVRRVGNYRKEATPFSEFLWADFFRRRIPTAMLRDHPAAALRRAKILARKREAAHPPEWSEIGSVS